MSGHEPGTGDAQQVVDVYREPGMRQQLELLVGAGNQLSNSRILAENIGTGVLEDGRLVDGKKPLLWSAIMRSATLGLAIALDRRAPPNSRLRRLARSQRS